MKKDKYILSFKKNNKYNCNFFQKIEIAKQITIINNCSFSQINCKYQIKK